MQQHFLELYGTLPRAGPGSNELTRRAYGMLTDLPAEPRILDVGCGPGMQTVELLKVSGGHVVALDILPLMIDRTRAAVEAAGLAARLETREQDMTTMELPPDSFDVVWSESAIYVLGFEAGLRKFRSLVKPGGYVVVSEVVWLTSAPPEDAVRFWKEYPDIDTIDAKLAVIERVGLEPVGHFAFPASAWTEHYYGPLEQRIAEKAVEWAGDPDGEAVLQQARRELDVFRRCGDSYTYAFFLMRTPKSS